MPKLEVAVSNILKTLYQANSVHLRDESKILLSSTE